MNTKTILTLILVIVSFGVLLLVKKNKNNSGNIQKKMLERLNQTKKIEKFKNSPDYHHQIAKSIINLLVNFHQHQNVGKLLDKDEIVSVEQKLKLSFPESYKIFWRWRLLDI